MWKSFNARDQFRARLSCCILPGSGVDLFTRHLGDDLLSPELNPKLMRHFVASTCVRSGLDISQFVAKSRPVFGNPPVHDSRSTLTTHSMFRGRHWAISHGICGTFRPNTEARKWGITGGRFAIRLYRASKIFRGPHKIPHNDRKARLTSSSKLLILFGGRGRNRTYNLSVKSRMLCQLSYASIPLGFAVRWRRLRTASIATAI